MSGLTDDISPRLPEGPRCEPVLQTFASVDESPRAHGPVRVHARGHRMLLDQYEFTLGVTESPFEGDTESHVAKAKNVLLGLRADDKQKQAVETEVACRHRVQDEDGTKSSFDFDFVVRVLALPPSQPIPALHRNSAISES